MTHEERLMDDDDNDSNDLECELTPEIPLISFHKLPEALGKIQESNCIENAKQVTFSDSDMSDDKLEIDNGADDDFEDIDDNFHNNYIKSLIPPTTSQQQTLPYNPTADDKIKVEKNKDDNYFPATKLKLTSNVLEAQSLSSSEITQYKYPKNPSVNIGYHPYDKREIGKKSLQKSLETLSYIAHNGQSPIQK